MVKIKEHFKNNISNDLLNKANERLENEIAKKQEERAECIQKLAQDLANNPGEFAQFQQLHSLLEDNPTVKDDTPLSDEEKANVVDLQKEKIKTINAQLVTVPPEQRTELSITKLGAQIDILDSEDTIPPGAGGSGYSSYQPNTDLAAIQQQLESLQLSPEEMVELELEKIRHMKDKLETEKNEVPFFLYFSIMIRNLKKKTKNFIFSN